MSIINRRALVLCAVMAIATGAMSSSVKGYDLSSGFIRDPETTIPYIAKCADFWGKSYDAEYGGFFTMVNRDGSPVKGDGLKTVLTQSRDAYGFARAYMVTGNKEYLAYARKALDFLYAKYWDAKNGGFHTTLNRKGELLDGKEKYPSNNEKWSFMQHYALLGVTAMYDATRDENEFAFMKKGRGIIDAKLWDSRKGFEGYYETADYDWSNPREKGFTPTLDGITTHGLSMYLLTNDPKYRTRLIQLADIIVARLYPTLKTRKLGFEEHFTSDWAEQGNSFLFIGHVLKTSWCLDRAYLVQPKSEYKRISEELLKHVKEKAWDQKHGGPFYLGDSMSGKVTDVEKNWWTLEQAVNAGLLNYHLTGKPEYLALADESAAFFEKHIIDKKYGDVFAGVNADGSTPTSELKGDYWKAGYHSIETGYYIYLYANLFVHKKPVSLYYMIEKSKSARLIPLNPVSSGENYLSISSVTLDGKAYKAFNAKKRMLSVPAGIGGEFKVTFAPNVKK